MFSKEEAKKLRQDFWISFGKSFPTKWIRYDTKIKGLSLKFHFDKSKAMVSIDIETKDLEKRILLWEKVIALKSLLVDDYSSDIIFEEYVYLQNNIDISRISIQLENVSIHNKNTWQETMVFLNNNMKILESIFRDFQDVFSS